MKMNEDTNTEKHKTFSDLSSFDFIFCIADHFDFSVSARKRWFIVSADRNVNRERQPQYLY